MVSAIGSAKYTPITAFGTKCGKIKINGISMIILRQIVRKIAFDAWSNATKLYWHATCIP